MAKVSDYRKIILVCDSGSCSDDLMAVAHGQGDIVVQVNCDDGIVMLVKTKEYESID